MKVFATTYGGGHVTMVMPVVRELNSRGHDVTVLALTTAADVMQKAQLPHKRTIDYLSSWEFAEARTYGESLLSRHHTEGKGIAIEESIAYLGVSYRDLVRSVGAEVAANRYREQGLKAFCPVDFMTAVLQKEEPDFVFATTSPRMEMATLRAAHALRIPSLCMVDLFAILELDWLCRPDNGDVLTVYNHVVKKRLVQAGRDPQRIFITGNPAFDALADQGNAAAGMCLRTTKGIASTEKVVLWAEQPEPGNPALPRHARFLLSDICSRRKGWRLLVRLHPSSTDQSKEVLPKGAIQSFASEPIAHVVAAADVIVTFTSTVAMEALLCNKPVLIIGVSEYRALVAYSEEDGALVVNDLAFAEAALVDLLEASEIAQKLLARRATLPKVGGAASRVSDVIESHGASRSGVLNTVGKKCGE